MSTALSVIQLHYAASERGDLAGMIAPFAEGIEWTEMAGFPYAGTYVGPPAVRTHVFERLGAEWSDYRADPESFVVDGDAECCQVVAFGVYSGTYRATGRSMRARFVHHWTLAGDEVVRFEQYTDTALVRAAMEP